MRRYRRKATLEFVNGKWQPVLMEEHVVTEIITRLWWAKIKVFRINQPVGGKTRQNVSGIPDLMGWLPAIGGQGFGVPVFIEVKRPKGAGHRAGARRIAQTRFIEEAKADGCVAFFADSWDNVVQGFQDWGIDIAKNNAGGKP